MVGGLFVAGPPPRPAGLSPTRAGGNAFADLRGRRRRASLMAAAALGLGLLVVGCALLGLRAVHLRSPPPATTPSTRQPHTPPSSEIDRVAAALQARERALARIHALPGMAVSPRSALEGWEPAGALSAGGVVSAASMQGRARRTLPAPPTYADGAATALASAALIKATLRDTVDPPPSAPPGRHATPPPPLAARRAAVRAALAHSWAGYVAHAWGSDELAPVSMEGYDTLCGIGVTILDSLDTLHLLGFPAEFARARAWVAAQDWTTGRIKQSNTTTTSTQPSPGCIASTFETTIRGLGGLLAAADLTGGDRVFVDAAAGLAGRLLPAFATPSGLPAPSVRLVAADGEEGEDADADADADDSVLHPRFTLLAEAGSVQLEFVRLAALLDRPDLAATAERAVTAILDATPGGDGSCPGLYPTTLSLETGGGAFVEAHSVGGRADSFYEYLLKAWLLRRKGAAAAPAGDRPVAVVGDASTAAASGRPASTTRPPRRPVGAGAGTPARRRPPTRDARPLTTPGGPAATERLRVAWEAAMDGVLARLVGTAPTGGLLYLTSDLGEEASDHLACFLPGNLALGVVEGAVTGAKAERYLKTAASLARTCYEMANSTSTGLAPESTVFTRTGLMPGRGAAGLLRPEIVESLYLLRAATGEEEWADFGWQMFTAFERAAKVPSGGYSGVVDVEPGTGTGHASAIAWDDQQPSWWTAETLKYFYLLFGDEADGSGVLRPAGEWVLNTEAHPLRVLGVGGRV